MPDQGTLTGLSNKPNATELLLAAGQTATGYKIMDGLDLGNADYDRAYSGARGTQGAVLASAEPVNRVVTVPLLIEATSQDQLAQRISALAALADECRRYGGKFKWSPRGSGFYQYLIVLDAQLTVEPFTSIVGRHHKQGAVLSLICEPMLHGPDMDVLDTFATNRLNEYTFDAGSVSDVAILSGELDAVATTAIRAIHTATGYTYGDHQATVKAAPGATINGFKAGVILKRLDASNYLEVYVDDNGANSRLIISKVVAGATTSLSSTNLGARVVDGTYFWVRGRIEGNVVYAEYFLASILPEPMSTPTTSASYALSTAEAAQFGYTVEGKAGWTWTPAHTNAKLDDFESLPYTYRNVTLPEELVLAGRIPGDIHCSAEAHVTTLTGSGIPIWALLAWYERPSTYNRCWNGHFEEDGLLGTSGWSAAAVTNISGAATSITNSAESAMFGVRALTVVCPATADTGASFKMFGRFRQGVTYTAEAWIRSAAAVTNTYIRLGNSAANDKATSSNTALSTTKQKITVAWTPSADRQDAHVAVNIAAATGTTFLLDAVQVYEGTTAPTLQLYGRGGFPAYGLIEAENFFDIGAGTNVVAASANYRSGSAAQTASAASGALNVAVMVDPSVCFPDDQSEEIEVEVWGRVELTATMTEIVTKLWTKGNSTAVLENFSLEFGSTEKQIPLVGATVRKMLRFGTIRLRTDSGPVGLYPYLEYAAGGATTASVDYLLLVPTAKRAVSPSGQSTTGFPTFVPDFTQFFRRIRSDLAGTIRDVGRRTSEVSYNGLGGSLLELPCTDVNMLVKLSSMVPDDPTSGSSSTETLAQSATVHMAVTPRYLLARSS